VSLKQQWRSSMQPSRRSPFPIDHHCPASCANPGTRNTKVFFSAIRRPPVAIDVETWKLSSAGVRHSAASRAGPGGKRGRNPNRSQSRRMR
jgi:hypothetical protein